LSVYNEYNDIGFVDRNLRLAPSHGEQGLLLVDPNTARVHHGKLHPVPIGLFVQPIPSNPSHIFHNRPTTLGDTVK
jgi:hypothetical protein